MIYLDAWYRDTVKDIHSLKIFYLLETRKKGTPGKFF